MGCNCGGAKNGIQYNYVYVSPTGVRKVYRSEIEAKAAQIRNKGGTYEATPKR